MADLITREHVHGLKLFDWALAHGPDYTKLAAQGAVVGGVLSLAVGPRFERGSVQHFAKYGAAGAAIACAGALVLFEIGKRVSDRSHEAIADASARGGFEVSGDFEDEEEFVGRGLGHRGFGRQGFGHQDFGGGDAEVPQPPFPHHPPFGHHGRW